MKINLKTLTFLTLISMFRAGCYGQACTGCGYPNNNPNIGATISQFDWTVDHYDNIYWANNSGTVYGPVSIPSPFIPTVGAYTSGTQPNVQVPF